MAESQVLLHFDCYQQPRLLWRDLTTIRAAEHTPESKVDCNVLKLMLNSRRHKKDVARLKRVPFAIKSGLIISGLPIENRP